MTSNDNLVRDLQLLRPRLDERATFDRCEAAWRATRRRLRQSGVPGRRQVATLASSPPSRARMLYRLTCLTRPARVVEFGSGLGRSGAYLAAALAENGAGRFTTIEGTRWRHDVARDLIEAVAPGHTEAIHGRFEEHFDALDGAGLVFIDGSHSRDATLAYADEVVRRAARPAIVVFDDIEGYSEGMESAWRECAASPDFELIGQALRVGVLGIGEAAFERPSWARLSPTMRLWRGAAIRAAHWRDVVSAGAFTTSLRSRRTRR